MPKDTTTPDQINELADALWKAQKDFRTAHRNTDNPFFKSRYASFAEVWEAVAEPLSKNGLFVMQPVQEEGGRIYIETVVMHRNGHSFSSRCPVLVKDATNPQAMGSAITYARRYSLASILGVVIAEDDDDGNKATGNTPAPAKTAPKTQGNGKDKAEAIAKIAKAVNRDELTALWKALTQWHSDADFMKAVEVKAKELKAQEGAKGNE